MLNTTNSELEKKATKALCQMDEEENEVSPSRNNNVCPWLTSQHLLNKIYAKCHISPKYRPNTVNSHPMQNKAASITAYVTSKDAIRPPLKYCAKMSDVCIQATCSVLLPIKNIEPQLMVPSQSNCQSRRSKRPNFRRSSFRTVVPKVHWEKEITTVSMHKKLHTTLPNLLQANIQSANNFQQNLGYQWSKNSKICNNSMSGISSLVSNAVKHKVAKENKMPHSYKGFIAMKSSVMKNNSSHLHNYLL